MSTLQTQMQARTPCMQRKLFSRPKTATTAVAGKQESTTGHQLNVVITGGTKGLGYCMALEFLRAGDNVVICGRDAARLQAALGHLQQVAEAQPQHPHVSGLVCDVSAAADVDRLQHHVTQVFSQGLVHRWINNAGQVTRRQLLHKLDPQDIATAVGCNVLGTLLCCRAAIELMQQHHDQQQQLSSHKTSDGVAGAQAKQQPMYHIFNMGFSAWGANATKSTCTHKSTKMALTQLNKTLVEELTEAGMSYIGVHNLSPGMVLTDLLLQDAPPAARRFFNALAEEPDTVAAALVPQIRAIEGASEPVEFLSPLTAVGRVLNGIPQIISGGRFFDKDGNRVQSGSQDSAAVFNQSGTRLLYDFPGDKY